VFDYIPVQILRKGENVYKAYKKDSLVAEAGSLEELYVSTSLIYKIWDSYFPTGVL